MAIFFLRIPRGKELYEEKKAQIESVRAADKSYIFIANHLHSRFCFKVMVIWHKKMKKSSYSTDSTRRKADF